MTAWTGRRSSWSRRKRRRLVHAVLEDPAAVQVGEEPADERRRPSLIALIETGDGREDSEEFRTTGRYRGTESASLREVRAIAAIRALPDVVDRHLFGRPGVGSVDEAGKIEIIGHDRQQSARPTGHH